MRLGGRCEANGQVVLPGVEYLFDDGPRGLRRADQRIPGFERSQDHGAQGIVDLHGRQCVRDAADAEGRRAQARAVPGQIADHGLGLVQTADRLELFGLGVGNPVGRGACRPTRRAVRETS